MDGGGLGNRWLRAVVLSSALWAIVIVGYAAGLCITATVGDQSCLRPGHDSVDGTLVVSVAPPGFACKYSVILPGDTAYRTRPGAPTALLQIGLLAWLLAAWKAAGRLIAHGSGGSVRFLARMGAITSSLVAIGSALTFVMGSAFAQTLAASTGFLLGVTACLVLRGCRRYLARPSASLALA